MLSALVKDGDGLFVTSGAAEPRTLLAELLTDVVPFRKALRFFQVLTGSEARLIEAARQGHSLVSPAPGPLRQEAARGELELLHQSMRQCAAAIEDGFIPVDGALLTAVRSGDNLALVPASDLSLVAFERARFRAIEILAGWSGPPFGPTVPLADVDYLVEGDGVAALPDPRPASGAAARIGELVADLIPDGATVELGVGHALAGIPSALIDARRQIAVHTGLASDWTQQLVDAGVATIPLECAGNRPVAAAIAMGTADFNAWLKESRAIGFIDSRHAHDPAHLGMRRPFVAVNAAMAVDVRGQAGSPSGAGEGLPPGGLLDFAVAGAYGGSSILALESRANTGDSRIVGALRVVQLPRSLVTHVVTEHGIADLRGQSPRQCRRLLIDIAHPEDRSALLDMER